METGWWAAGWLAALWRPEVLAGPVLLGVAAYLLLEAHPRLKGRPRLRARLDALERSRGAWAEPPAAGPLAPLGEDVGRLARAIGRALGVEDAAGLRRRLALAWPGVTPARYLWLRLAGATAGLTALLAAGAALGIGVPWWAWPLAALVGSLVPRGRLGRALRAREARIRRELPPALRALAGALEGGLTLPDALADLPRRRPGVVAGELRRAAQAVQDGREPDLAAALRALAARNGVAELTTLAGVLAQGLRHDLPAAAALRTQIAVLDSQRRAERRASAGLRRQLVVLPALLLLPVVLTIVLYPAAPRVATAFGFAGDPIEVVSTAPPGR